MSSDTEKDKYWRYRTLHRAELNAQAKAYYAVHKEEKNAYDKTWNRTHKEYKAERAKRYYVDHVEQERTRMASYRVDHKELMQQDTARWRKQHPEQVRASNAKHARGLGYTPLNLPFPNSDGHHIDKVHVLHIPKILHCSINHNIWTGRNMEKINTLVVQWWMTQVMRMGHTLPVGG